MEQSNKSVRKRGNYSEEIKERFFIGFYDKNRKQIDSNVFQLSELELSVLKKAKSIMIQTCGTRKKSLTFQKLYIIEE